MTALEVNAEGFVSWPLRECAPWCTTTNNQHATEHPEDRSCWSDFQTLHISRRTPVDTCDHQWAVDWLDISLRRRPGEPDAVVLINDETNRWELELTPAEAQELVETINRLLALEQ